MDWIDDGRHSQAGGQDAAGTGQAAKGRIGAWDKANLVSDGPLEKKWVNWVKLSVGRAEIQQFTGRGRYVSHNCQKRTSHRHRRRFKTSLLYYCTAIHPSLEFQSQKIYLRGFHFIWDLYQKLNTYPFSGASGRLSGFGCCALEGFGASAAHPLGYWDTSIKNVLSLSPPLVTMSSIPVKYLFSHIARSYLSPEFSQHRRAFFILSEVKTNDKLII